MNTADGRRNDYGMGWHVDPVNGYFKAFHTGGQPETWSGYNRQLFSGSGPTWERRSKNSIHGQQKNPSILVIPLYYPMPFSKDLSRNAVTDRSI